MANYKNNSKVKPGIHGKVNNTSKPGNSHTSSTMEMYEDSFEKTTKGSWGNTLDLTNEFAEMDFRLVDD